MFGQVDKIDVDSKNDTATVVFTAINESPDDFLKNDFTFMGKKLTVSSADAATSSPSSLGGDKSYTVGFTIIEEAGRSGANPKFRVNYVDDTGFNKHIKVNDYIISVDGTEVAGKSLSEVRDMLKGKKTSTAIIIISYITTDGTPAIYNGKFSRNTPVVTGAEMGGGSAYSTHAVSNISQKNRSMTNSNGKGKRKGKGKNKSKKQNATKKLNRH